MNKTFHGSNFGPDFRDQTSRPPKYSGLVRFSVKGMCAGTITSLCLPSPLLVAAGAVGAEKSAVMTTFRVINNKELRKICGRLTRMIRLYLGTICGLVFGVLSAATMVPLSFPDKRAALLGAFLNRLSIGVVIGLASTPERPGWLLGLAIGVLLSLADAIITKAYAPILILGAVGGSLIGWIVGRFGT